LDKKFEHLESILTWAFSRQFTIAVGFDHDHRNISIDNIGRIAKGLKVEPWRLLKDIDCGACAPLSRSYRLGA